MRTGTTSMGPHFEEMSTRRSRSPTSRSTTPPSCGDSVLDELRSDSLWPDYEKSRNLPGNSTNAAGDREISIADLKIDLFLKRFYEREQELGITTDDNNNQILPSIVLDFVLRYSIATTCTPSFPDESTTPKAPSVASDGGALQQLQQFSAASKQGGDLQQLFASTSYSGNQTASPQQLASAASPQPVQQLQPPDSPRPTSTSPDYLVPLRRPPPTAGYRAKKERYRPPVQPLRQPSFLQQLQPPRKEAFKYRGTYSQRKPQPGVEFTGNSQATLFEPPQMQDPRLAQGLPSQSILKFPQNHDPRRVLPAFCLPLKPCPQQAYQPTPRGRPRVRAPKATMQSPLLVDRNRKRPQKKSISDTWNRKVQRTMDAFPQSVEREDCMIIGEIRKTSVRFSTRHDKGESL